VEMSVDRQLLAGMVARAVVDYLLRRLRSCKVIHSFHSFIHSIQYDGRLPENTSKSINVKRLLWTNALNTID